jgi:hypothetical protein
MQVAAIVAWVNPPSKTKGFGERVWPLPEGCGVEFCGLTERDRLRIEARVRRTYPSNAFHPRFRASVDVRLTKRDADGEVLTDTTATESISVGRALARTSLKLIEGERLELEEVEGPFRSRVRVLDVVPGVQARTLVGLEFLDDAASERVRDLIRRCGVLATPGDLLIEADIAPAKTEAIEDAVMRAFRSVPGSWRVHIGLETTFRPPWWIVTVSGAELLHMALLPAEQTPELLEMRLTQVLRRRRLV